MEKNRKILITNDDGIESDGLRRLAEEARKYGEVWVIAPDGQRSAASHSLTISTPLDIYPVDMWLEGVHAFSCTGLPADCFRIGSKYIMPDLPDIVFSGINNGFNVGTDIQYSATVGAAFDAAMLGFPTVAFSEGFLNDPRSSRYAHQVTNKYLPSIMRDLFEKENTDTDRQYPKPGVVLNINFPDCSAEECRGILWHRKVSMNTPYVDIYKVEEELPRGGKRYSAHWVDRDHADEGTDLRAILDHYISIGIVNNIS